jgi:hypothetical protein
MEYKLVFKDNVINQIIEIEWEMFVEVKNIGETASCQKKPKTFKIMRSSQFAVWSEDTLTSYLKDLVLARKNGRNIMTEKYARMMKFTSPQEYLNLAHLLPTVSKKKLDLINKIVKNILKWEESLIKRFPAICKMRRPVYSSEDKPNITSIETYLNGEFSTYSYTTLMFYHKHILQQKSNNINASEITLLLMAKAYGWKSLKEANDKLTLQSN